MSAIGIGDLRSRSLRVMAGKGSPATAWQPKQCLRLLMTPDPEPGRRLADDFAGLAQGIVDRAETAGLSLAGDIHHERAVGDFEDFDKPAGDGTGERAAEARLAPLHDSGPPMVSVPTAYARPIIMKLTRRETSSRCFGELAAAACQFLAVMVSPMVS